MVIPSLIQHKRDGGALRADEWTRLIAEYTAGRVPDYQMSALLMAVVWRGLTTEELAALTDAMLESGDRLRFDGYAVPRVDKHSTGGVGDKVSLLLAPIVATCGVAVPMMSGRGLGHTGGTLDKLEAIPGFRTGLSLREAKAQVERIGCAMLGQTPEIAPADRRLYALRDSTATVESIPLICASILSKKLAEGIEVLVLDVKFGRGAFMKDEAKARELASALVSVATAMGKPTRALLTSMDEPLGRAVGNALEVAESIECLRGHGPADTMEVTFALGEQMLLLAGAARTGDEARHQLREVIASGAALEKFREMIRAQGGDVDVVDNPSRLPQARLHEDVLASRDGWVSEVDAMEVALAALRLGAGRARAEDSVDHAVGVSHLVKCGERVERGTRLCRIHANDETALREAKERLAGAMAMADAKKPAFPRVREVIGA